MKCLKILKAISKGNNLESRNIRTKRLEEGNSAEQVSALPSLQQNFYSHDLGGSLGNSNTFSNYNKPNQCNFLYYYLSRKTKNKKHLIRKSLKKINKAHHSVNYVNLNTNDNYKEYYEFQRQTDPQATSIARATSKNSGSENTTIANVTQRTKVLINDQNRIDHCSTDDSMRRSIQANIKFSNFDKELADLHTKIFKRNSNNFGNANVTSFPLESYKNHHKLMSLTSQKKGVIKSK